MPAQALNLSMSETPDEEVIDIAAALELALSVARSIDYADTAKLPLEACHGRILENDVCASSSMPKFNTAKTSGYAICRADLAPGGSHRLKLARGVRTGEDQAAIAIRAHGAAIRVAEGAIVPTPYDAVLAESAVYFDGRWIDFENRPAMFENIQRAGDVFAEGDLLVASDKILNSRDVALLASADLDSFTALRKLSVSVLTYAARADEVDQDAEPDNELDPSRAMLMAELGQRWVDARDLGMVRGNPALLTQIIDTASAQSRIVMVARRPSEEGVDHLTDAIAALGGETLAANVAIRAGENIFLARLGRAIVLGVPRAPEPAFRAMQILGWPILRAAVGLPDK